jgi:hypothetical protein
MTDQDLIEIQLLDVPLELRSRSQQHSDELMREMTLVALQIEDGEGDVLPVRLTQLAADVQANYGAFSNRPDEELDAATARGDKVHARVVYHVPPGIGPVARHIIDVLEETDQFCREGNYLLSLAAPPDIAAFRHWALEEFERQSQGGEPRPWGVYAASRGLDPEV